MSRLSDRYRFSLPVPLSPLPQHLASWQNGPTAEDSPRPTTATARFGSPSGAAHSAVLAPDASALADGEVAAADALDAGSVAARAVPTTGDALHMHSLATGGHAMNRAVNGTAGGWSDRLDHAKAVWRELTVQELAWSGGDAVRLAGLVRERYTLSRREAEQQVKAFLQDLDASDVH